MEKKKRENFFDTLKKPVIGRPKKWATPEELQTAINQYFEDTDVEFLTVTGLALAVGSNRQCLINYEGMEEFSHIVKNAKAYIENSYEISLRVYGRSGDIFALKNFGWKDRDPELGIDAGAPPQKVQIEIVDGRASDAE